MNETKPNIISFRATCKERKALGLLAARESLSPSAMLRQLLREGLEKRGMPGVGLVDMWDRLGVDNADKQ